MNTDTQAFILQHRTDDIRQLALQAKRWPGVDMPLAIKQIAGWQTLRHKVPSWAACDELAYPLHLPLEQCSSEATARYKQQLAGGARHCMADLTGGFGIDCFYLSRCFEQGIYVERQTELVQTAEHNFSALGADNVRFVNADSREFLQEMEAVDCIFIDPARRDGQGGKTVALADCEPNLQELEELLLQKSKRVIAKLSPMLDLSQALSQLNHVSEAHIVSVGGECKELLLVLEPTKESSAATPITCVNIRPADVQSFTFSRAQEQLATPIEASDPLTYLYEPNASVLKAGAFRSLCTTYGVGMLHVNSHLYTSAELVPHFPGRIFRIKRTLGFGKADIKMLKGTQANLSVRNFPASVAELRRRLHLADGGDAYLFATTIAQNRRVLIDCEAVR